MTIERMSPSGGWSVSTVHKGYLVTRRYFGYTKREAVAEFKAELKERRA